MTGEKKHLMLHYVTAEYIFTISNKQIWIILHVMVYTVAYRRCCIQKVFKSMLGYQKESKK